MRAFALSLLLIAAAVYVATRSHEGGWEYLNAAAEAAMVGAIADWFAVTALFRHPLGLPIPHTAIIPRRKQALGESLQEFVAENFLNEDVIRKRVGSAEVSRRVGEWVASPGQAERIVSIGSRVVADALSYVRSDDVAAIVHHAIVPRLQEEPLAPAAGQLLTEVLRDGSHVGLVDLALDELHRWLVDNEGEIASLVEDRAPWWTPHWVDSRVAGRLQREALAWIQDIRDVPDHRARRALDAWLTQLAYDLQHDAATQARAEALKSRVLSQPRVVDTAVALWDGLRRALVGALQDEDGLLRARVVGELRDVGERLRTDESWQIRLDTMIADAGAYVASNYGHEIATVISATVDRWDGKETAERIELHVGRDLQFIRINGTVVGALAGLTIHALSTFL